jgi:outer membrane lipoprotein carrier protein
MCLVPLLLPLAASAATNWPPSELKEIKRAQDYLNGIQTLEGGFQQVLNSSAMLPTGGGVSEGHMYLKKPGKLKWVYRMPSDVEIYVDKNIVTYYDRELDQISYTKLEYVLSNLIAQPAVDLLEGDLQVIYVRRDETGVAITIQKQGEANEKSGDEAPNEKLILTFLYKPTYHLYRMQYLNTNGQITTLQFMNLTQNAPIDDAVFEFKNPRLEPKKRK